MNILVHFLINYSILSFFIPNIKKYIIPVAIFSIILDLDYLPSCLKFLYLSKEKKSNMQINDYVKMFRTAIQEPIGILIINLILAVLYFYSITHILLLIAMFSIIMHWFIDFLTIHTRPLYPVSKKIVCLFFKTKKQRIQSEIIITILSIILFILTNIY